MEQPHVELIVRLTARLSAAAFASALALFAVDYQRRQRPFRIGIRLLVAFVFAHTIHFSAVAWLAALTSGENIRDRGGWVVALIVAALFYVTAFGILRSWRTTANSGSPSRAGLLASSAGVMVIAVVFLNSYVARVADRPLYWLPSLALAVIVVFYLVQLHGAAARRRSSNGAETRGGSTAEPGRLA